MRSLARAVLFLTILSCVQPFSASAQESKETGSITGHVMLDGKPAPGVIVIATPSITDPAKIAEGMFNQPAALKATTDSDGRYRIEAIPSGAYRVAPATPTLVSLDSGEPKDTTVTDSTTVENIDFALSRGGIVTGRVTDSEGHPVIGEEVSLNPIDPSKSATYSVPGAIDRRMYFTDDRGIYRIYGVPPGRYTVSAGAEQDPFSGLFARRPKRVKTYYPGVSDSAGARPVELSAGTETSNIDIKLGSADKGFTVSGRVLDAQTRKPVANAMIAYGPTSSEATGPDKEDKDQKELSLPGGITTTNGNGEFRFDSLAPGKYKAEVESLGALSGGGSEFFADPVSFEVHSNIDKLEIKVHSGASISGVVVVENVESADPLEQLAPQLAPMILVASVTDAQSNSNSMGMGRVAGDGSFRIGGLKPGRAKLSTAPTGLQKYALVRIERNGLEQFDGIDIQANEQIVGLRVIVAQANCSIRVHVTIQGNPLRQTASVVVHARPLNGDGSGIAQGAGVVVENGDVVIENIPPGDFEITASATLPGTRVNPGEGVPFSKQTVTVTRGIPAEVSLVINVRAREK